MIRPSFEQPVRSLVLVSILAAGCGGGDAVSPGPAAPAPVAAPPAAAAPPVAAPSAPAPSAPDGAGVPGDPAKAGVAAGPGEAPVPLAVPIAGSDYVRGRSAAIAHASIQRVREAVSDFAHYAEFMPHYRSCKVLGRTASGARDVYMEVEALNGVVKMWAEIEAPTKPVLSADGVETYKTRFLKGNVKDFAATWRLKKIDDATTELSLEVFLDPGLPLPTGLVNKENLGGSSDGVAAMRVHAEQAKK